MTTLKEQQPDELAIKEEDGIYLKGIFGNRIGYLVLTNQRIAFVEQKMYPGGLGLIGATVKAVALAKGWDKKLKMSVLFAEVTGYEQGKHGRSDKVLLLHTGDGKSHKILFNSTWEEWKARLDEHVGLQQ